MKRRQNNSIMVKRRKTQTKVYKRKHNKQHMIFRRNEKKCQNENLSFDVNQRQTTTYVKILMKRNIFFFFWKKKLVNSAFLSANGHFFSRLRFHIRRIVLFVTNRESNTTKTSRFTLQQTWNHIFVFFFLWTFQKHSIDARRLTPALQMHMVRPLTPREIANDCESNQNAQKRKRDCDSIENFSGRPPAPYLFLFAIFCLSHQL